MAVSSEAGWGRSEDLPASMTSSQEITREELQLAVRNHAMPLEGLRYPITPVGLHYLLVHFDIPTVDPESWTLSVEGRVRRPLALTLDDVKARPPASLAATLECAGNGRALMSPRPVRQPWLYEAVGTAEWTGTPLRPLLEEAGAFDDAEEVVFTGLDRGIEGGVEQSYERSLPLSEAIREEVLLAYEVNGQPLPPQHGFPLRLLVPGWYGMTSVKWLARITVVSEPFQGYQQAVAYRFYEAEDEPGPRVTRIYPRSLMLPPGIPEYMTRTRYLPLGPTELSGRAWSGWAPLVRVEVSADGGATWDDAKLGDPPSPFAWSPWSYVWNPPGPGSYELLSRATDAAGNTQPLDLAWNVKGYANNVVQRVQAVVRAG